MGLQDVGVWLIGVSLMILSVLKLATWDAVNGLMFLSNKFQMDYFLWINDNFIAVWAIAGLLIYLMYRPNNFLLQWLKKILTLGKG